jgi:hypothetical protein
VVRRIIFALILFMSAAFSDFVLASDSVKTPEAAIAAAKQAWGSIHDKASRSDIYSKESTRKFEPYTAVLKNGVWIVTGSIPPGYKGTVLETHVRESDGSVSVNAIEVR